MTVVLFNKPYDVLSQFTDRGTAGSTRRTLSAFIDVPGVYPAGRLDLDSEGLMVLTNDGRLQARIADPDFKMPKTYLVQVEGDIADDALDRLRRGVTLKDGPTRPAEASRIADPQVWPRDPPIRVRKSVPDCWIDMTIREGRNRQVRRMTAAVGHPTLRLIRWGIGPWTIDGLQPGEWQFARVKVYFDGGCRPAPVGMETAVVVRGRTYLQCDLGPGTSLDAEWLALIRAVEIARELDLADPVFLGDALAVILPASSALAGRGPAADHLATLRRISEPLAPLRIRHIKRTQNLAGIALARRSAR